jgi:5-methylcytosine-specific restriction protein A
MQAPPKPCRKCGAAVVRGGMCARHYKQADKRRGTSAERGYDGQHVRRFRSVVLERDPVCPCGEPATRADHYPIERRDLVKAGLDANDPAYGRGLCERCHNRHTASKTFGNR